jgi:hypothetical protein
MILKYISILIAIFLSVGAYAQADSTAVEDYVIENPDYVMPFDSLTTKDKMHYSFEVGAGFGKSTYGGDYFSTYYRPMVSYAVSPKFSINAGLTYINSSVNNMGVINDSRYQLFSGNISQYNAFIGGEYQLTDRLSVGGSVFYDFTAYTPLVGTSLDQNNGLENLGYSGYVKYKVSDSFSIEAEVRINDRNPYQNRRNNPFSSGFMGAGTSFPRR